MMQGPMLQHLVMHKLAKRSLSGYQLCKELAQSTGHKPSYGSIYPLLDKMAKEGLVKVREDSRKKIYSLTASGKSELKIRNLEINVLVDGVSSHLRALFLLTDQDPAPLLGILQRVKQGDSPLGPVTKNMIQLRDTVFRMVQDGRAARNEKEINKILLATLKKLEGFS